MKFEQALKKISDEGGKITRNDWFYSLGFNRDGYLIISDHRGEIGVYTINKYDFDYIWETY